MGKVIRNGFRAATGEEPMEAKAQDRGPEAECIDTGEGQRARRTTLDTRPRAWPAPAGEL